MVVGPNIHNTHGSHGTGQIHDMGPGHIGGNHSNGHADVSVTGSHHHGHTAVGVEGAYHNGNHNFHVGGSHTPGQGNQFSAGYSFSF